MDSPFPGETRGGGPLALLSSHCGGGGGVPPGRDGGRGGLLSVSVSHRCTEDKRRESLYLGVGLPERMQHSRRPQPLSPYNVP